MCKPGEGGSPRQASGGPPLEIRVGALGGPRKSRFRQFSTGFIRFLYFPPQTLDLEGAIPSPEFAVFRRVIRFSMPPPDIGIHIIRHVAQNLVLVMVFKLFL